MEPFVINNPNDLVGSGKYNNKKRQWEGKLNFNGTSAVVIVGLDGYDYKYYQREGRWDTTRGFNVHVAFNGPMQMTFLDFQTFQNTLDMMVTRGKKECLANKENK